MGQGCPILLLHSSMSSKLQWYRLMYHMSHDYHLIAVDLYGYGDSPFPSTNGKFCIDDEIALVDSLLEGVLPPDEPLHLVGHSFGGAVALKYCYSAPERFRSLTLYEPVAFHLLAETEEALIKTRHMEQFISQKLEQGDRSTAAEYFIDFWSGKGTFTSVPREIRLTFEQGINKLKLDFRALLGEPLTLEDYKKIDIPVCLMAGRKSPIESRRVSELLAETLPNCKLHMVDGGHMAPVNQGETVNTIIENFIKGLKSPGMQTGINCG